MKNVRVIDSEVRVKSFSHPTLCTCCTPDENGNPVPDPSCAICGGEGVVEAIDTMPSGEVGDVYERRGMYEKH